MKGGLGNYQIRTSTVLLVLLVVVLILSTPLITFASEASLLKSLLWKFVANLFGTLVGLAGLMLNLGINTYVVGFGQLFQTSGIGDVVNNLWAIIRDIFNLTFIFGLVYIGLSMILDSSSSNAKIMLRNIIIAALLVNFSLFFTKTIVDFTNLVSYQIVTSGFAAPPPTGPISVNNLPGPDISGSFMHITGLTTIMSEQSAQLPAGGNSYSYIFFSMILFIIMAFVFFAGGLLLLIRFAVLSIYIIFSPIMFIGMVIPKASGLASEYWKGFIQRAFFAPAYILMLYFSYRVLSGFQITNTGQSLQATELASVFSSNTPAMSFAGVIATFGLTSIFLVGSLIIGQKMGAVGANAAVSAGSALKNKGISLTKKGAGGATAGAVAFAGRNTLGRYGNYKANDSELQKKAATSWTAKQQLKLAKWSSKKSYDARQVAGIGSYMGVGTGAAGGYSATLTAKKKREKEFMDSLGTVDTKTDEGRSLVKEKMDAFRADSTSDLGKAVVNNTNAQNKANAADKAVNDKAAEIAKLTAAGASAQAALEAKQAEVKNALKPLQTDISKMEKEIEAETNIMKKNLKRSELSRKKAELTNLEANKKAELAPLEAEAAAATARNLEIEKVHKVELEALKAKAGLAQSALKQAAAALNRQEQQAQNEAEAAVKYSRQTAYLEAETARAERMRSKTTAAMAAGVGGTALGLATGGLGFAALGALAAGGAIHSIGSSDINALEAIKKDYGKNAMKMAEREKLKNEIDLKTERVKEFGLDPEVKEKAGANDK